MIQQINRISEPQKAKPTQPQEDTGKFESLLKTTVTKLKDDDKKPSKLIEKEQDDKKGSKHTPVSSSLAAMLQEAVDLQPAVVKTQVTDKGQLPILHIVDAQAGKSVEKEATPFVGAIQGKKVSMHKSPKQAVAQQNPDSAITNAGKDASVLQLIPNTAQQSEAEVLPMDSLATVIPTKTLKASQRNENVVPTEKAIKASTKSIPRVQQQAVKKTNQSVDLPPQFISQSHQDVKQTEQTGAILSQSAVEEKQAVLPTDKKTIIPIKEANYNNQNLVNSSNLFKSGNVVIKVSDEASSLTQTACNQVSDNIVANFKAENPQFQMNLYPQDLGKVAVKLAIQNGVLTVEILAANPKTQSMLMANANEIKSMLQATVNQPVRVLEPTQDKQWYQQQGQPNQQQDQPNQQKQQQHAHPYANALNNGDITTDDFLSVMQNLRQQSYQL